jgi:serine protease Do
MNPQTRTIILSAAASGIVSLLVVGTALHFGSLAPFAMTAPALSQTAPAALSDEEREKTIIGTVQKSEPAVVSVIISKDLPVLQRSTRRSTGNPFFDQFFEEDVPSSAGGAATIRREIGGGTAFFVSSDGLLMTNKHVVDDSTAQYTVLLNDGRKLEATVVGRDPLNDIALLKVNGKDFPFLKLSAQKDAVLGQTVIAIGNALGEFRNTVSVGVISGLQRSIMAGNPAAGDSEQLNRILQTDAAINEGNSGGPLLDSSGLVIGMSTAVAADAQNIGFAIPVQDLGRVLAGYQKYGHIVRPYIGVRYTAITPEVAKANNLGLDHGALIIRGDTPQDPAVIPGSPADKAGLRENDIIVQIDGKMLSEDLSVADIVQEKLPGDTLSVVISRQGKEQTLPLTLEEWKETP